MLDPLNWTEGGEHFQIGRRLRYTDRPAGVFAARMRQLEAVQRWLAGYFQAAAILLQLPGGADYVCVEPEGDDEHDPGWDPIDWADLDALLSVLAACFERLEAEAGLIRQLPGGADFRPRALPMDLRLWLAEQDDNGVLNLVAECLDRLLVIPRLGEEERRLYECPGEPRRRRWWRLRWRGRSWWPRRRRRA